MSVTTIPGNMAGEAVLQVAGSIKIAPDHHAVAMAIRGLAAHAARQGGSPEEIAARIEAIAIEAPSESPAAVEDVS